MSSDVAELERAAESPLDDWREVAVADVVAMLPGFAFKSENFVTDTDAGLPLIRIRDLGHANTATRYVGDYDEAFAVRDGDILVGMDGTFEAVRWQGGKALLNQRVLKLSPARPDAIDEGYLFYRVQPALSELEQTISGTTVKHLSTKDLKRLRWQLPPLDEQRRIAEVLRSVDEAIAAADAAHRQARETLRMARTELVGLNGGKVNWATKCILDCFQLQRGHDLPVQAREQGNVPVIASNGRVGVHNVAAIPGPSVITGRSGTIGKVSYYDGPSWPLNTTLYVKDFRGANPRFVFHFLSAFPLQDYQSGTGVPTLNRNDVHAVEVQWPSRGEQQAIAGVLDRLEEAVNFADRSSQRLIGIKRALMSDLLSGRVRVSA